AIPGQAGDAPGDDGHQQARARRPLDGDEGGGAGGQADRARGRLPQARADQGEEAQGDGDLQVQPVEPGAQDGTGGDGGGPAGGQGQPGGQEVLAPLGRIGAGVGVAIGHRPRGVDDETGGGEPEPSRLPRPPPGQRRAVDDEAGVDQEAGEDGGGQAGAV